MICLARDELLPAPTRPEHIQGNKAEGNPAGVPFDKVRANGLVVALFYTTKYLVDFRQAKGNLLP